MFKIDGTSRKPIYQQLQTQILQMLALGTIAPGDPLPSVRVVARELAINPNTVAKAYSELELMKVIYSVSGKGSFISENITQSHIIRDKAMQIFADAATDAKNCGISHTELGAYLEKLYFGEASK